MTKKLTKAQRKRETQNALINAALGGALVFAGGLVATGGVVTIASLVASFGASLVVFCTKLKDFFAKKQSVIFSFY